MATAAKILGSAADELHILQALYGMAPGSSIFGNHLAYIETFGASNYANVIAGNFANLTSAQLTAQVLANLKVNASTVTAAGFTAATDIVTGMFEAAPVGTRGDVLLTIVNFLAGAENDGIFGNAAKAFNDQTVKNYSYSVIAANNVPMDLFAAPSVANQVLVITSGTAAGADLMRLTGDQDVRIDFTNRLNQIKGLDLNGDGIIANDGQENTIGLAVAHTNALYDTPIAANYAILDAYKRDPFNEGNLVANMLGDIRYDGTGYAGDGVGTNGNIVLGGLGGDTVFGGIGNDFLTGGGVAATRAAGVIDSLSGGRNADFFFVEMSALDNTDGNRLAIDGGVTADDNSAGTTQSAQDADWLLFEGSDDDEPVTITLRDDTIIDPGELIVDTTGSIVSRSGQTVGTLRDIENMDASGNLYGFLNNVDVQLGGRGVDGRDPAFAAGAANNGIGSSAQLRVIGSNVGNIIIGGYDNDVIEGNAGNDLLMGGNLRSYTSDGVTVAQNLINPNLVGLVGGNNGRDELIGGTGNDSIVFEADGGVIEGGATQNVDDTGIDTLWITEQSLGTVAAAAAGTLTTDSKIRIDLAVGKVGGLANAAGYGGADKAAATGNYTADQTNYNAANAGLRVQVQDMENVIATGLGAIDYRAAGSNSAADLVFANQQNFQRYVGDLDLRGTFTTEGAVTVTGLANGGSVDPSATTTTTSLDGAVTLVEVFKAAGGATVGAITTVTQPSSGGVNILYASNGADTIEGRTGGTYTYNGAGVIADNRDKLSGGNGLDTFIFGTQDGSTSDGQSSYGDNIDVIHRQLDANGDNIYRSAWRPRTAC